VFSIPKNGENCGKISVLFWFLLTCGTYVIRVCYCAYCELQLIGYKKKIFLQGLMHRNLTPYIYYRSIKWSFQNVHTKNYLYRFIRVIHVMHCDITVTLIYISIIGQYLHNKQVKKIWGNVLLGHLECSLFAAMIKVRCQVPSSFTCKGRYNFEQSYKTLKKTVHRLNLPMSAIHKKY
jgi:hypothetical protein